MRDELIAGLKSIPDENGRDIGTQVYRPEELYKEVRGVAPDLIVYFGDLYWRSVGTIGGGKLHTFENDTGPDGANHARKRHDLVATRWRRLAVPRQIDGRERSRTWRRRFWRSWGWPIPARHGGQTARAANEHAFRRTMTRATEELPQSDQDGARSHAAPLELWRGRNRCLALCGYARRLCAQRHDLALRLRHAGAEVGTLDRLSLLRLRNGCLLDPGGALPVRRPDGSRQRGAQALRTRQSSAPTVSTSSSMPTRRPAPVSVVPRPLPSR